MGGENSFWQGSGGRSILFSGTAMAAMPVTTCRKSANRGIQSSGVTNIESSPDGMWCDSGCSYGGVASCYISTC